MDPVKHPRRAAEQRERDQAQRASALASSRLPSEEIRKRLGLGPVAFEQFIARNSIRLPAQRSKP